MTVKPLRFVIDTNVLIAACIRPQSVPGLVLATAIRTGDLLRSDDVVDELDRTIRRAKFDRYQDIQQRLRFISSFVDIAIPITAPNDVQDCRDPRDNIFLSLALAGHATCLITGDADLLALNPWRDIPMLTPAGFLAHSAPPRP